MIQAVIFDCFGVLTTDTWRAFVASLPEGMDTKEIRALNHAYDAGVLSKSEFLEQVHELTGRTPVQVETMLSSDVAKNTELLDYIRVLKHDFKIGLLSNIGTNWIRTSFLSEDEQALFDTMVFSYETGMTKPDPRIYELVCDNLSVQPEDAVFIDDIAGYCTAARDIGMKAVVYESFTQTKRDLDELIYPQ